MWIVSILSKLLKFLKRDYLTKPHKVFLCTSLLFGILIVFLTPPFQGPDETVHFFRSVQISNFDMSVNKKGNVAGGNVDTAYAKLVKLTHDDPGIAFQPDKTMPLSALEKGNDLDLSHKSIFVDFGSTATNPPIAYLPSAVFIKIGTLIGFGPLSIFYLARIGGLLAWAIITYYAIKIIPGQKWALVIANFIPMLLFQAGMVTADSLTFALLSLFVAEIIHLRVKEDPVSRNDWIRLIIIIAIMSISKRLMFFFSPLIFLVRPYKKVAITRFVQALVTVLSIPFSMGWAQLMRSELGSKILVGGDANPTAQINFLKGSPIAVARVTFNTYFSTTSDWIIHSIFGVFGSMDTPLPIWIVIISSFITLIAITRQDPIIKNTIEQKENIKLKRWEKLLVFSICASYFMAVNLALYVYYTPPKFATYYGVQGRYFLPILITLILFFVGTKYEGKNSIMTQRRLVLVSELILIASLSTLFLRYYVI
ncbi:MAG: DUF2142 domain-containing protein [Acidimicrobiia bacterium]